MHSAHYAAGTPSPIAAPSAPVIAQDRLQRAAAFIAQLNRLSIISPHSWRRAVSVGRHINLDGAALELAMRDAEKAGFLERRADDESLVILMAKG